MSLLAFVWAMGGNWGNRFNKASRAIPRFAAVRVRGVPVWKGHSEPQHLPWQGNGHIQWVTIQVITKPVPHGSHTKHISCFTQGVPLGIYGGDGQSPSSGQVDLTVGFIQSTTLTVLSGITSCVSGSCICDHSLVSFVYCTNPNVPFHPESLKQKTQTLQWPLSPSISVKVLEESDDTDLQMKQLFYTMPVGP